MFKNLEVFKTAQAMAKHATARQAVIARNVANADTPAYKARDIRPFAALLDAQDAAGTMRATRSKHFAGQQAHAAVFKEVAFSPAEMSPNGNSVSIETEMLKSLEAEKQHSRALAIYQNSLNILKTSIGRGR